MLYGHEVGKIIRSIRLSLFASPNEWCLRIPAFLPLTPTPSSRITSPLLRALFAWS